MEDRYIETDTDSRVLSVYASGISSLRLQAHDIAEEILSKPPSYWNSNPSKASEVLSEINQIELSENALDAYKEIHLLQDE